MISIWLNLFDNVIIFLENMQKKHRNIILIGFMGTGKSIVGKKLSHMLKMNYIDTDEVIEKSEGKSIPDIFKQLGEDHFRSVESRTVTALQDYDNFIIATGGGIVLKPENVEKLKNTGYLVLLTAAPEVIFDRVKGYQHRPLLSDKPQKRIIELLGKRNPIYRSVADIIIDTSNMSVDEVAREIIRELKREGAKL